jgi:curli biogenesis system outer membrane secretion channel CsgG
MPGMLRDLKIELRIVDVNGREISYASTWHAPDPITLTTGLTDHINGYRAEVKITDPIKADLLDG